MKKIVFFTMIAFLFASVSLQAQDTSKKPQNDTKKEQSAPKKEKKSKAKVAEITFESLEHDYGSIYKGDNGECEFIFKNTGKAPLQITNARASCGCTVPSWPREPIAPGKKSVIKVKYDTNRLGTINKSITVTSNAVNNSVVLHIKGSISEKPAESVPAQEAPMMKAN